MWSKKGSSFKGMGRNIIFPIDGLVAVVVMLCYVFALDLLGIKTYSLILFMMMMSAFFVEWNVYMPKRNIKKIIYLFFFSVNFLSFIWFFFVFKAFKRTHSVGHTCESNSNTILELAAVPSYVRLACNQTQCICLTLFKDWMDGWTNSDGYRLYRECAIDLDHAIKGHARSHQTDSNYLIQFWVYKNFPIKCT